MSEIKVVAIANWVNWVNNGISIFLEGLPKFPPNIDDSQQFLGDR